MTIVHGRWQETQSTRAEATPVEAVFAGATLAEAVPAGAMPAGEIPAKAVMPAKVASLAGSIAPTGGAAHAASRSASHRYVTIDAVRAACLFVVVVLHSLMVGVEVGADGGLETSVALSGQPWFAPLTWVLQIMPLFFIAGGFASLSQWRRMRDRGASAAEYVLGRVRRLVVPALLMIVAVGGVLTVARACDADPELIAEASLRIGQPLWFLVVYLGVTSLVPVLARLHERWPLLVLIVLGAGIVAVDLLHAEAGIPVGYLNLALVWPFMQQLGFVLADSDRDRWSRGQLTAGIVLPLVALGALLVSGRSPDMIENLNPPTLLVALLGLSQFFGLQLVRARLERIANKPRVRRVVGRAGALAMTTYLWHMPIILALVTALWLCGGPLPAPHSAAWWATRAPWILGVALCVLPFAVWFARVERRALTQTQALVGEIPRGACGESGASGVSGEFGASGASGASARETALGRPAKVLPGAFAERPSEARTNTMRAFASVLCAMGGTAFALIGGVGTTFSLMAAVALCLVSVALTGTLRVAEIRLAWLRFARSAEEVWSQIADTYGLTVSSPREFSRPSSR